MASIFGPSHLIDQIHAFFRDHPLDEHEVKVEDKCISLEAKGIRTEEGLAKDSSTDQSGAVKGRTQYGEK